VELFEEPEEPPQPRKPITMNNSVARPDRRSAAHVRGETRRSIISWAISGQRRMPGYIGRLSKAASLQGVRE